MNPALLVGKAWPQDPRMRPAIGRHGHRVQETHRFYKPFYFLYWVYTNLQYTNAELMRVLPYLYL